MPRTQGVPVSNTGGIWQLRHFVSLDISYFNNIVFINCLGKINLNLSKGCQVKRSRIYSGNVKWNSLLLEGK